MLGKTFTTILFIVLVLLLLAGIGFLVYMVNTPDEVVLSTQNYSTKELEFVKLINEYRVANGASELAISDMLSEAADRHSSDMAKFAFFSHTTEQSDFFAPGATPWERMYTSGYTYNTYKGENIAAGQATAQIVFDAWKNSPGHNTNMLNHNYKAIGIGLVYVEESDYKFYWTTDFGGVIDYTASGTTTTTSTTTTTVPKPTTTTTTVKPTTTTTTTEPQYFTDIGPDFYAYKEIQYTGKVGYFQGYKDGTFRPYENMLVGHIHNILKDGITTDYYKTAVRRYVSDMLGVPLYGKENFELSLDANIVRSQVAILLYSKDTGERVPSVEDTLIGYLDKSESEIAYLKKYATGAKLTCTVEQLVGYYNKWGPEFGIRADFALAQAIKETGHFEYGGVVKWDANNFCGLSAGPGEPTASFATAELGVIAHLAHLACYAYPDHVNNYCSTSYDPKHRHSIYNTLNPNGGSTTWIQLNGVWAVPGYTYAQDVARIAARF